MVELLVELKLMSCLCRKPRSPYWMVKYRDGTGRIVMRSTKQTNLRKAQAVATNWEKAARLARAGELTQSTAIKILGQLMEETIGERLEVQTVEQFLREWLEARSTVGRSDGTVKRYAPIMKAFIVSLGPVRSKASI